MQTARIIEQIADRLGELLRVPVRTLGPEHGSAGPDLLLEAGPHRIAVQAKDSSRLMSVRQACEAAEAWGRKLGAIPLVAVPFMGPSGAAACRAAGVSFADLSGNAHVEAPGVLIHVEGMPNRFKPRGRPASAFAPKSARVARLMLLNPARWWRQIELAERAELGRGYISRIVSRLAADGHLEQAEGGRFRPADPDAMLDAWRDEYAFDRHRVIAGHVGARSGGELAEKVAAAAGETGTALAFTGLAAAAAMAPHAGFRLVAAYVEREPAKDFVQSLDFHAEPRGANLWLVVPFDEGVFHGAAEIGGRRCVSAVQAYLDLLHMPERAAEAAAHLRETRLRWR